MGSLISVVGRHRVVAAAVVAAALIGGFVLWFYEPQALVFDDRVSEAAPQAPAGSRGQRGGAGTNPTSGVLSSGTFRALSHHARGQALIIDSGGRTYLRFENFEIENGPDLRVYLSRAGSEANGDDLAADFIDLGGLKGNIGDQNYAVPEGTDLSRYRSAVVWCRRFSVGFAVAPVDVSGS